MSNVTGVDYKPKAELVTFVGSTDTSNEEVTILIPWEVVKAAYKFVTGPAPEPVKPTPAPEKPKKGEK